MICGRTDIAPSGWIWRASAKDGRAIFAKEGIDNNTQHSRENFYSAHRRVSDLPIPDSVKLILQIKEDFPVWVDLTSHIDAVERQIIYPYPDPSTGNPLGRVVRRQWSDRRPVYQNREKSIRPEYCVDSCSREEDKWVTGKGKKPWPLYREAEVQEAIARGESTIFYGAGEQAVESFRKLGLTAFCNQGGEGTAIEQIKDFLKTCKPPLLVVWADHDKQGKETKVKLLKASKAAGIRAVAIDPLQIWLEMPVKGDITNVLGDSGMEPPEIIRRLEAEIYRALNRREQTTVGLGQERQKLPAASAIAAELAERYYQQLAFDASASRFLSYEAESPGVWSELSDIAVQANIQAELDSRPQTIGNYNYHYVKSVIELLKGYLQGQGWDKPTKLLPFRNGILNLETHEFLPPAPYHRLTWTLPRDYNPSLTNWDRISEWMDEVTGGDESAKNILCCWLNACIKGRSDLQRFLHLKGPGGSGQGTFMHLCVSLVGSMNVHSSTLVSWCENRFEPSNAYGKRLVAFWDQDQYQGKVGSFRSLTGEDLVRGEFKNKQAFQFEYTGMTMLSSNSPIFAKDTSSAMERRALIFPFSRPVALSKRRNLGAEFEPELAALTNYVLSITDEVVTQTLLQIVKPSAKVLEQTWETQIQEDSIAAWLNEYIIVDAKAETQIGSNKDKGETLFGCYWQYCDRIGERPLPGNQFTPTLLDLCQNALKLKVFKRRSNQFHYLVGLRLRTSSDAHIPIWQEWIVSHHDGSGESHEE